MHTWRHIIIIVTLVMGANSLAPAGNLQITRVRHDPHILQVPTDQKIHVTYDISAAAAVTLEIYDARDRLTRRLPAKGIQAKGNHTVVWNLRNETGQWVPPNYYTYILRAQAADGKPVVHDLTDITGGQSLKVPKAQYDPSQQQIAYVLTQPAIVNIRIGLSNGGPLLHTLIDWVPRGAGYQREPWDGWDGSRQLEIGRLRNYQIGVSAYALPHNSVVVTTAERARRPVFMKTTQAPIKRPTRARERKQMYNHWQHPRDRCYDPLIRLDLLDRLQTDADGLPIIQEPVVLRLSVAEADRSFILDQRFEVVFYVDFVFIYEEELGYTPFNWRWDPQGLNPGIHHLTAMLRGYEGHFGTATLKVLVQNPSVSKPIKEQ